MINLLLSLLILGFVKLGFLWLFVPKEGGNERPQDFPIITDNQARLVEIRDVQATDSYLSFGLEGTSQIATMPRDLLAYAIPAPEWFAGER